MMTVCSIESGVDAGDELLELGEGAIWMDKGRQGAMVEQCGSGAGSLGTKAVSRTATIGSYVQIMAFGESTGFHLDGADAGLIFVCEDAGAIWSLS